MSRVCLFLCLLITFNACSQNGDLSQGALHAAAEERRLVVTFVDRSLTQTAAGNAGDDSPMNGPHPNSRWSERLAHDLAERHHILFVAQWSVSALGLSCVVYEVPAALQVQRVMTDLQNDHDVALVQRLQSFQVL